MCVLPWCPSVWVVSFFFSGAVTCNEFSALICSLLFNLQHWIQRKTNVWLVLGKAIPQIWAARHPCIIPQMNSYPSELWLWDPYSFFFLSLHHHLVKAEKNIGGRNKLLKVVWLHIAGLHFSISSNSNYFQTLLEWVCVIIDHLLLRILTMIWEQREMSASWVTFKKIYN